ncbi:MAG: hypothetical protein R3234_09820, partial [Thermoanaerobaculia bacterium]|nr:hypothetical protein [Thermoanaerobaculia bacterium]
QGEPGWSFRIDGETVDMLAPVGGPVERVNEAVLRDPTLLCQDPYGRGWLLEIRCPRPRAEAASLLTGRLAEGWMEGVADRLSSLMGPSLGPVLQDGGIPVSGFAREVAPGDWSRLAKELLLTGPAEEGSRVAPERRRERDRETETSGVE